MAARLILAVAAAVFTAAALIRVVRDGGVSHPQTRTWLLVGAIFALISAWLFLRT